MKKILLTGVLFVVLAGGGGWFYFSRDTTRHCLLLFGVDGHTRVWVTVAGQRMELQREDAEGRLVKIGRYSKFDDCKDVELADADGRERYVIQRVSGTVEVNASRRSLFVSVEIKSPLNYRQYCDVELVPRRSEAKVAHFDGPLTVGPRTIMWKVPPDLALRMGDEPAELSVFVGTMDAERGCWVVVRTHEDDGKQTSAFPPAVYPAVDIEFPPRLADAPPVRERYYLDQFC